jgi:hypothetical protein
MWDELAGLLSGPRGLETVRLLQHAGLLRQPPEEPSEALPDLEPLAALKAPLPEGRRRICLIGESAAEGFFYAPWLTPAKVLAQQLTVCGEAAGVAGEWEVVDWATARLQLWQVLRRSAAALRARPDAVVVFAGNNWLGLGAQPDDYADDALDRFQEYAEAVEQGGPGALRWVSDRTVRAKARRGIDRLGAFAKAAGVPLLFVVPAANLVDFEVRQPVFWLPGDGVARWHELYRQTVAALERGDPAGAAASAREMTALDGGDCATAYRLLATALLAERKTAEAAAALTAHYEAGCWDARTGRGSASPSPVRDEIAAGCRRHHLPCIDLTDVFTELTGSPLLDRRLFLDHCHQSAEGICLSMAAVAAEVLRAVGATAPPDMHRIAALPVPDLPPPLAALSRLHAALYNAHINRPAAGGQAPVTEALIGQSIDAAGGVVRSLRDYMAGILAPGRAYLTAACERNQGSRFPLQALAWLPSDLNIEALEPMARALESRGEDGLAELDRLLLENHSIDDGRRDIAGPRFREQEPVIANTYALRQQPPSLFRARWPTSNFFLVTAGERAVDLDITLRLPPFAAASPAFVEVSVNGYPAGRVEVIDRWQRQALRVEPGSLRRGLNRVSLTWPLPGDTGDAAIRTAVERLRQGLPADLYPIFGEVFSLWATPQPGPAGRVLTDRSDRSDRSARSDSPGRPQGGEERL